MKTKRIISFLLALLLVTALLPTASMAAIGSTWSGTVCVYEDQTVSDVTAMSGCKLDISSGVTLTVRGTITINGGDGTLRVVGDGKLIVEAPNGKGGGTNSNEGFAASDGLPAVQGSLSVENGVVEITGGSGGNAGSGGTYGIPGAGASAITGNLAVERGTVSVTGGSGGSTSTPAAGGSGQPAVAGSLTVRDGEVTITGGNGGSSSYASAYSYGGSGGVGVAGGTLWISGGKVTVSGGFGGRGSVPAVSEHGGHGANANPTADRCSINWDGVVYCYDSEGRQTAVMNDICVTGNDLNGVHTITSFSLWERMLRELADGKSFETDYLTAPAGASVTIPQGLSVTVNGTLTAGDGTDTVTAKGEGTLTVHGKNGANGGYNATEGFAGHDGGSGVCGNLIIDGCDAEISGGSGGNAFGGGSNAKGGQGAPAITGSLTVKDGFVTVNGGTGGYSDDSSWGGNAGAGVVGDLTVELGTVIISGGKGGNVNHQNAYGQTSGNGGDGVSGNALILGGSVTVIGNNGGSAVGFGRAGNGGSAVRGDLTIKDGSISLTGGTGGDHFLNEMPAQAGDGGSSVAGGVFFYGGSVYTEAGKSGTIPGEGLPSSDGKTVAGTFSNLSGRAIFALDSNGAVIYRFDETEYNDDGFREQIDRKIVVSGRYVAVTAGKGMAPAPASGDLSQCVAPNQPINDIVLIADGDSYFPEDYASVGMTDGISVIRSSSEQITITGTPNADVSVTLAAPTAKAKEPTPTATFTATGPDTGALTGVTAGMTYAIDGGAAIAITGESVDLTGLAPCTITVIQPGNGTTTVDSDEQTITVTKAEAPALTAAQLTSVGGKGSIPTAAEHEFSTDGTTWTACTGETTGLVPDTYYVREKAVDTVLASDAQEIVIIALGSVAFSGRVTLNGRPMTAGDTFTFEVSTNGTVIATAQSDATGNIDFTEINYFFSDVGQHSYTVKQSATTLPGVAIDGREYTVDVIVSYNPGNAALTVTPSDNFTGLFFTNTYDKQTPPEYSVPTGLKAIYGQTLADVTLPDGWAWDDAPTTSVGNVGDNTFSATYTPDDTTLYKTVTATLTIAVSQATPDFTAPDGLTAVYGQTLADVTLPDGWAWDDALTTSVGNVGDNTFSATYTPDDTTLYKTVTATLTVSVAKAGTSSAELPEGEKPKAVENLIEDVFEQALVTAPEKLPEGYTGIEYSTDGENWSDTVPTGKKAGEYTVRIEYIGDANHENFAGDPVAVTIVKAVYAFALAEGEELKVTKGSGKELTATVVQTGAEDTSFEHFAGVYIGEAELQKCVEYTVKKGSTVVTILPATLDKLDVGNHTLTVRFTNGEASAQFTVLAANSGDPVSPQTGDNSHIGLWIILMTVSAIAATSLIVTGKRKRIFGK